MEKEILHYVKYILFKSDLPRDKLTKLVENQYQKECIQFVEKTENGSVYRIESTLPERNK